MMPPKDKTKNNRWYWLWLVFIVWVAVSISRSEIITGIILLAIGGVLTLIGQLFLRKLSNWFSPKEELCEIFFLNIDKVGNRIIERHLHRPNRKASQNIPLFLQSPNPKELTSINIRFGIKQPFPKKFYDVVVRRYKNKRLFAYPSPNWWADFRTPTLQQKTRQPQISRVLGVYLSGKQVEFQPAINNEGCSITFNTPFKIPIGYPFGESAMQIDLEINANSRWKGNILCASRVGGTDQFVVRKVDVSENYGVTK